MLNTQKYSVFFLALTLTFQTIAAETGFSRLASFVKQRGSDCRLYSGDDQSKCLSDLLTYTQEVLTCEASPKRASEMAEGDRLMAAEIINDFRPAVVPENLKNIFKRLTDAAVLLQPALKSQIWSLSAYNSKELNAQAGADFQILASAGLWEPESILTEGEVTATLAHEIGHTMKNHSLVMGCLALEWAGGNMILSDAILLMRDDFSLYTERGRNWSSRSQAIELEADALATQILQKAGMNPDFMAQALIKLKSKNTGGFSSGSHPDLDLRIRKAIEAAVLARLQQ